MGLRGNWRGATCALGLALLSLGAACEPATGSPECGETGTYHDGGELGRHCSYIVIVGGFTCPEALPFRHDFAGGEVVCSDHETAEEDLPEEVCNAVGRNCRPPGGESCRWDKVLGGAGPDAPGGVAVGADGTVYAALSFEGSVDFGGGPRAAAGARDSAIVAFDGYGRYLWDRVIGGESWGLSLAADASGVVVSGGFEGTVDFGGGAQTLPAPGHGVFVLALNSSGGYVWDRVFGDAGMPNPGTDVVGLWADVAIASDGSVRIIGNFGPSTDFGGGVRTALGFDGFVVALDGSGAHLWDRTFGGADSMVDPLSISLGTGDEMVIGGGFGDSADFGGGVRNTIGSDGFVVSLAADGSYLWDRILSGEACGDPSSCAPTSVIGAAIIDDGSVVVAGAFADGVDFGAGPRTHGGMWTSMFVAAYDAAGAHLWDRTYGQNSIAAGMVSLGSSVAITGGFSNRVDFGGGIRTPTGSSDAFVLELTNSGAYVFDEVFLGTGSTLGLSIAASAAGNLVVGGHFSDRADFGHGTRNAMNGDTYVTRICR